MLPIVYSFSLGHVETIPLDPQQRIELLMTLGQALTGMMFLLNMSLAWWEAGALLVRPDLYVGWRHRNAVWTVDQARKDLIAALRVILGQDIKPTIPQEEPA